ncbi:hypothetical protein PSACC_01209 [Paramicrosporidium saccamoebae]|uniref:Uncharacterized protein n=1 Tax=Paramicrosporidium saccamoebae TaxID=1246581 RepID=A0A2H9TMK9_9FUNG|nr:hypothetical protein PSACC_01209 [Paramicrosporidium saccamoebae]
MNVIAIVFALICACATGLGALIAGVVSVQERGGWLSILGFMSCLVVLFCGPVAATDGALWSFGIGAALVLVALGALWGCLTCKHRQQTQLDGMLKEMHPEGSWDAAIAIKNYRGIDESLIQDFKRECLHGLKLNNVGSFGKKAALLLFVEPTQAADYRRWFVECAIVLKQCSGTSEAEILAAVEYIWSHDVLSPELKRDLTLLALGRVGREVGQELCRAIIAVHAADPWVEAHLPKPPKKDDSPSNLEDKISESLESSPPSPVPEQSSGPRLERWYLKGDHAECRLCGFRPANKGKALQKAEEALWHINSRARKCETCRYRTMGRGLTHSDCLLSLHAETGGKDARRVSNKSSRHKDIED